MAGALERLASTKPAAWQDLTWAEFGYDAADGGRFNTVDGIVANSGHEMAIAEDL